MPDNDTTQDDEQPADEQPAEQPEEQPAESDQPAEQPAGSDQPVEQAEEQPSDSDQPAEPSEEQPAESDQSAATGSADNNTVALAGGDAPPSGGGGGGSGGSQPSKDVVVKNERAPADPLPANFVPKGSVETHRVSDGEDWASVAKKYNVDVKALIYFNFQTNNPDEVNWYLRRNTGCNVSKDGGVNWAFSSSAIPGKIYIPPSKVINMEPYEVTAPEREDPSEILSDSEPGYKPVMQRIQEIANTLPGNEGGRIRGMLAIESLADPYQPFPGTAGKQRLWYYNPIVVKIYILLTVTDVQRREMTKDTNGQFPFDGDAGPNFQHKQPWRIYPFGDIVAEDVYLINHRSDSSLKIWLLGLEADIYQSWRNMSTVEPYSAVEGPLIKAFLDHVHDLAETPTHLYYIYAP